MPYEGDQLQLFNWPDASPVEPKVLPIHRPVWTENKARLISQYLYLFVQITKHGTYIDGFAGPQNPDCPDSWAAKLVLESEPRWLRHFYFYDIDRKKVDYLRALKKEQPEIQGRTVHVSPPGDFNVLVKDLLDSGAIREKEATFCLLDQRTFQCKWSTLKALAQYKSSSHKIELFYFLAAKWFDRAWAAVGNNETRKEWWGRSDLDQLMGLKNNDRAQFLGDRIKDELGYASVKPWPIFQRYGGGATMYYMIHATDHPAAPMLMSRAYRQAVSPQPPRKQLGLFDQ